MPNIKKAEYDKLKNQISILESQLVDEKLLCGEVLFNLREEKFRLQRQIEETEKWKRYYEAVRETLQVEAFLEIPGCFNPMDAVEYVVKKQEEV